MGIKIKNSQSFFKGKTLRMKRKYILKITCNNSHIGRKKRLIRNRFSLKYEVLLSIWGIIPDKILGIKVNLY